MALLKQPWLGCPVVHYRNDTQCHPSWSSAKADHCGKLQSARCRYVSNGRSKTNIGSSRIAKLSNLVARCMEDSASESSQGHSWETNGRPRSGQSGDSELTPNDRGPNFDSNSEPSKDIEEAEKSRFSFEGLNNQVPSSTSKNSNNFQFKHSDSTATNGPGGAKDALPDNTEWKNVFPTYMQSRQDDSDGDNDEIVQVTPYKGNGQARGRVNGVAAAKAAAAATASAKALEWHVNARNLPSTPALATPPCSSARPPTEGGKNLTDLISHDPIWAAIRAEARLEAEREPLLSSFLYASILAHPCFERSLGFVLANRLTSATLLATQLMDVFDDVFLNDQFIQQAIRLDVQAIKDRDPSCRSYSSALLYLKGYHALQSYRVAHNLWNKGSTVLALALQARISEVFAVDIHPAARIGKAILLDHGTGVVIGETAVIGDRVSLLQGVTLGGTGKAAGDRHPKIREGVLLGAGATILGNIVVGRGAMVAAGSLVLKDVPAHSMVAGTPAKVVGFLEESTPSLTMKHDVAQDFCQELEEAVRRQLGDHLWGGAGI